MSTERNLTPEGFRTAAYLEARARMDLRSGKGPKCKPPNRACGDRCIPPNWKCRVKGEGTDSHSRVVAGDPLAGAAAIARGRDRLTKGLKTGNLTDIQAGRAAIARGLVKSIPGKNLKQKQELRNRVEQAIVPVATGLFAVWALRQAHEGAKRLFPVYEKGLARDIENSASTAVGFVLDRIPVYGSIRQQQRRVGSLQARVLAQAARRGVLGNPGVDTNNRNVLQEMSDLKIKGLRDAIRQGLEVRSPEGKVTKEYEEFRSRILGNVLGAERDGKSVYADDATINYLSKQYGIDKGRLVGADNTQRKHFLITNIANGLRQATENLQQDMLVRGLDRKNPDDIEKYLDVATVAARDQFNKIKGDNKYAAVTNFRNQVRQLLSSAPQHRTIASDLYDEAFNEYDAYFKKMAARIKEDTDPRLRVHVASSPDSPIRAALISTAERIKRKVKITAPIAGANHAELVLQRVYHEYSVVSPGSRGRSSHSWLASDTDIKYAAQDLGWDGQGGVQGAYGVLKRSNQFPYLEARPIEKMKEAKTVDKPPTGASRPARTRSKAARISDMMRQKNKDGSPRYATREAAEAAYKRMRGDAAPSILAE